MKSIRIALFVLLVLFVLTTTAIAGSIQPGNLLQADKWVSADIYSDVADYTTLESASASDILGDGTTQFLVTDEGSDVFRYTWTTTGTDPEISVRNFPAGKRINITGTNLNAANNVGLAWITGSGSNYFEITNAGGLDSDTATIGTGQVNLGSTFYVKKGLYTLAADFEIYTGQTWIYDGIEIATGASDSHVLIDIQTDIKLIGELTLSGTGDSGNEYVMFYIVNGSHRVDAGGCKVILKPSVASINAICSFLLVGTGGQHSFQIFVPPQTVGVITAGSARFVYCFDSNSRYMVNIHDVNVLNTSGTLDGIVSYSVESTFIVNVDELSVDAGGGASTGVIVQVGGNYSAYIGSIYGNDTNMNNAGTGNNVAALVAP